MVAGARRSITALALAGAISLVAAACGGGGKSVAVTLKDFTISLAQTSMPTDEVTFKITNDGPSAHEFVIFKTDLPADQLPTTEENGIPIVDEEGEGIQLVDEVEDINPGDTPELKVTLQAGNYVAICNVPAHYQQGMHIAFSAG